ncbi:aminoacyl-tRNA hydrolase [candidate division WWE3 bacterium]|nr:aminoacyl-tRNA hydrolase [candidate division WWE3 bacterium]
MTFAGAKTKMKLIIGLGNIGKAYKNTRHNVGFILLDEYASQNNLSWKTDKKAQAKVTQYNDIILAKPQTMMNRSGITAGYLSAYFKIPSEKILLVHDDVDLAFAQTKLQKGVGPAGHKGVEDVIVSLKTKNFWRFRVGVGRPKNEQIDTEDWVLSGFSPQELDEIKDIQLPIGGY